MFERLLIREFAILEYLDIDFRAPFTALTGETGAGKSIVIEAVSVLLGARSSAEMIRHGARKAYIEGVFSFGEDHPVYRALVDAGWADEEERSFTLSRELNINGKNPCRVNGHTVSYSAYRLFAGELLDIHGQHEYQRLMQAAKQADILDAYGGKPLQRIKDQVFDSFGRLRELESRLEKARQNRRNFERQKDFLLFQLREIEDAAIKPGEDAALEAEIQKLTHSRRIFDAIEQAYACLYHNPGGESAYDSLTNALRLLKSVDRYDPDLTSIHERLEPAGYIIDEVARDIIRYRDLLDVSPSRLESAESRLYRIRSLGKKYGGDSVAILSHRDEVARELEEMEELSQNEELWEAQASGARADFNERCAELSRARAEVIAALEPRVDNEFLDLAMKAARFKVEKRDIQPGQNGADSIEFLISTNTGEPFLPLIRIASGGELSRITLALKRILASSDTRDTLMFDEIDSGIGGTTIQAVADKLASISLEQQVICVTHSPVIASKANQHLLLEKSERAGRTVTLVKDLEENERIVELTRMLGGDSSSEDLLRYAAGMLKKSDTT